MGRRRKSDGAPSFDSLLDTLTNVVGILVIMLIVTLLGVRDAVRRIKWEIPDISEAKLEELRRLADLKQQKLSEENASIEETQAVLAKLKKIQDEIDALRKLLKLDSPEAQLKELRKKLKELEELQKKLEEEAKEQEKLLAEMRKRLAKLPKRKKAASNAKMIRMPQPRSPVADSKCVWFMCRDSRISRMDHEELLETALKRIASSKYLLSIREKGRVLKVAGKDKKRHPILKEVANWVLDPEKAVGYFTQKDIGDRNFRLSLRLHPTYKKERLYATYREGKGETAKDLRSSTSRYESVIRKMDPKKQYARFLVSPESFEVYVRAREIVEKNDIPAGWLVHPSDEWQIAYDFGLNLRGEKKPEPAPPAPPPPADAPPKKKVIPMSVLD
ncbi:MAG: hypothetical protein HN742_29410 [Lentisphaerae bacterium]|mgnify:CR=1 FL=1|jgi:hypothetical protein|nr:hypothetical protein [Lentisphaerota bacterium]MBT4821317.1 hypothetical protein [Lentisphaerota bacterium]MBT5611752.1 hypothetical protein [Lentisphaerota bacterium]MBT7055447.1 hypothetical protein [Lentisphaerota bacterium]MBT7846026.1 hypothetical protein [Lentisphaerota bacterium]